MFKSVELNDGAILKLEDTNILTLRGVLKNNSHTKEIWYVVLSV